MILMIRTRPAGGYQIAYLVLNYGTGIRFAKALQVSRRELPELLESVQAQAPLIDLTPAHCQRQIALVQQMNLATRTPVPEEFFMLRDPHRRAGHRAGSRRGYTRRSARKNWTWPGRRTTTRRTCWNCRTGRLTLPESVVQAYADALAEIDDSKIVVSEAMQRERMDRVFESAMQDVLGEESRAIMRFAVGGDGLLLPADGAAAGGHVGVGGGGVAAR